jgi:hypothetical protein
MTVLTFSQAQLSPADLATFDAIATPNLKRGLWSGIQRRTGRDYDRFLVTVPQNDQVLFSFERDREGTYRLFVHDRGDQHCIGTGRRVADCLAIWRHRRHRPLWGSVQRWGVPASVRA